MIKKYLWRNLKVEYINWTISLYMTDKQERISYFDDLSDWEKSLLTIIFWLYGNDLTDWFIIIKEPELHIHPQYQKELAEVCENISEQLWTQFIFSTNSGLFINEKNLNSVYRVYKDKNQNSLISAPRITVDYDDATLMHMLRFENLSKIFFVDKLILVEWDTDAYFFSFYLNYLKTLPEWKDKIRDYEIININGKGSFVARRRFLRRFDIKNYFIWDRDNTVDFWFFSRAELNKYYLMANQQVKKQRAEKRYCDYYNRLVKTILTFNPKKHKAIIKWIEKMYSQNVFILKEWAIETYVPTEKKGLAYVAYFCNAYFYDWLHDENFAEKRNELEDIMKHIFG
jgi:predicted ATP-dependent endonuclease of OLD family